ncbi:MAG: MbnP family protein [Phycisphaerales bacterium]
MRLAVLASLMLQLAGATANGADIEVAIGHTFDGRPLAMDDVSLRTRAGNIVSVSRLDYLLSEIRLVGCDGATVPVGREAEFISLGTNRTGFTIGDVPNGDYTSLRFRVGLPKELNHADPARFGPSDPLHPVLNGLHWGWQGGYVFAAIEGRYELPGTALGGYSFHVGTDELEVLVRIDGAFRITDGTRMELEFDVAGMFPEGARISPDDGSDSTHSAPGDELARKLAANLGRAFSLRSVGVRTGGAEAPVTVLQPPPAGTTPYELPVPARFPAPFLPSDNPLTREGIELGRRLFFDGSLSGDGTQSCAGCHQPSAAFADPGRALSLGITGEAGTRNTMPLFNLAWNRSFTWDGKRSRIRDQALAPIQNEREMNQSLPEAVEKITRAEGYEQAFRVAFGSPGVTAERIGLAIEQYLLTLVSATSKYDRVRRGEEQFSADEQRGMDLFVTEFDPARGKRGADCFHCHGGELFSDYRLRNNGLDSAFTDRGRAEVTGRDRDVGRFKTPSLRNVEVTGPYMHDGRFATLDEAIAHYAGRVRRTPTLDANLAKHKGRGVELSEEDRRALKAFLLTLTDEELRAEAPK